MRHACTSQYHAAIRGGLAVGIGPSRSGGAANALLERRASAP